MGLEKLLTSLGSITVLSTALGGCIPSADSTYTAPASNIITTIEQNKNNPQLIQEQEPKYTLEDLRITYKEWKEAIENPKGPERLLLRKKAEIIYQNPKATFESFSADKKVEFGNFFNKSIENYKDWQNLNKKFPETDWEKVIRKEYDEIYPFKINLKNPELRDKLVIFLHESKLEEYLRHKNEGSPESRRVVISDLSQYATPIEITSKESFKFPFKILDLKTFMTREDFDGIMELRPEKLNKDEFDSRIKKSISFKSDRLKFKFQKARILSKEFLVEAMIPEFSLQIIKNKEVLEDKIDYIPKLKPIDSVLEECVKQRAIDAIKCVGSQGGYFILPDEYLGTSFSNIAYGLYNGEKTLASKKQIEKEIAFYVDIMMPLIDGNFSDFKITGGRLEASSKIYPNFVSVSIKMPISVSKEREKFTINRNYETKVPIRLGRIHSVANEIIEKQAKDPNFINLSYLTGLDYDVLMVPYDDKTLIYTIKDEGSKTNNIPYIFRFANKVK